MGEPAGLDRLRWAVAAAVLAGGLAVALADPAATGIPGPDRRANVVVVLTDDQVADSLLRQPPAMPFLRSRLEDPDDHWVRFPNAFLATPMCCPSRATLLTGRYAWRLGVRSNGDGARFADASTVATWLDLAGYETAYVGKYLNGYPWGRGAYVPPGWDRWVAKMQGDAESVYFDYRLNVDGRIEAHGSAPEDYFTDVAAGHALGFLREVPEDRPFMLWFAPTSPHPPWTPAPRHEGAFVGEPFAPEVGPAASDPGGLPAWVRVLPVPDESTRVGWERARRSHDEALLAVDEAIEAVVGALEARGDLDRTAIFVLSDNGYSFGQHRWFGKACPYDECTRAPFVARLPGQPAGVDGGLISSIDLAPTIADLAGVTLPAADGQSLLGAAGDRLSAPRAGVEGLLLDWAGGNGVPPWWAVRTKTLLYVEYASGDRELFDVGGVRLEPDPRALHNVAGRAEYAGLEAQLRTTLARLRSS